jgi:hypothetical protein
MQKTPSKTVPLKIRKTPFENGSLEIVKDTPQTYFP